MVNDEYGDSYCSTWSEFLMKLSIELVCLYEQVTFFKANIVQIEMKEKLDLLNEWCMKTVT